MVETHVLVIGCGNMGAALAAGYADAYPAARVVALDQDPVRARSLLPVGSTVRVVDTPTALDDFVADVVILALKPQVLRERLGEFAALCASSLVISIAAGLEVEQLRRQLNGHARILRVMPNLPVVVGQGMSVIYAGGLGERDVELGRSICAAVGAVEQVDDEAQIDIATAVAGSGPAYFFAMVEHLAAAGVLEGLSSELAQRLARQTCIGAAALLAGDTRLAAELKAAVCSPRGTTEAGLAAMEGERDLPGVLAAGVAAAHRRARQLAVG